MILKEIVLFLTLYAYSAMCFCQSLASSNTIVLEQKVSNGPFFGGRRLTKTAKDKFAFKCDSSKYAKYLIKYISFEPDQNAYDELVKKEISKESYDDYILKHRLLNRKFVEKNYNHRLYFLIGQLNNGTVELTADLNYNKDFTDDTTMFYRDINRKLTSAEKKDTLLLPLIRVNYEYYDGGQFKSGRTIIQPNIFRTSVSYSDSLDNSLPLVIDTYEHKIARFRVYENEYDVFMSNFFLSAEYAKHGTEILIRNVKDTTRSQNYVAHSIGDSIKIDNKIFTLKDLSYGGDTLLIETKLSAASIRGFDVGYRSYDFTRKDINDKKVSLSALEGNYIILDFWGTWCVPCIEGIPMLKMINEKYSKSKLKIISLSVDSQKNDVLKYIKKYNMNWININDVYENKAATIASLFRVTSFPTFIVISPLGEILLREESLDIVEQKLRIVFFSRK